MDTSTTILHVIAALSVFVNAGAILTALVYSLAGALRAGLQRRRERRLEGQDARRRAQGRSSTLVARRSSIAA